MKRAFISRSLGPGSPFRQIMEAAGWAVHGESLLELQPMPFAAVPAADWLFFYSKNAVHYFFQQIKVLGLPSPPVRYAAIGPSTAAALLAHLPGVDFVGTGDAATCSADFLRHCAGQRVLFPKARHSRDAMQVALGGAIEAIELAVYDNVKRRDVALPPCEALVFTSPLNAEAYFDAHALAEGQILVAIGRSTAQRLGELVGKMPRIAASPDEAALAAALLAG